MLTIVPAVAGVAAYAELNAQPCVLFNNLLASGTITDATLPAAAPRSNAVNADTYDFWRPASAPDTLRATFGSSQAADMAFFVNHDIGTAGASLVLQWFDGSTWQTITTVTPTSDDPFGIIFPERSATGWGVQITGAVAQIGVAMIGKRTVIPGGVQAGYRPVWASRVITKAAEITRRGHYISSTVERAGLRMSASFAPLPMETLRDTLEDFRLHYDDGLPFVWASCPGSFPEDCAYVWAPNGSVIAGALTMGGEYAEFSMELEGYAEP